MADTKIINPLTSAPLKQTERRPLLPKIGATPIGEKVLAPCRSDLDTGDGLRD